MLLISSVVSSSMDYKIEKAGKVATDKTTVSVIFQTIEEANAKLEEAQTKVNNYNNSIMK